LLFVGDDWAEDHHDVELMDASGRKLSKARLPEGVAGMARLHAMIGAQLGEDADELADQVVVGIETDRGPWVQALAVRPVWGDGMTDPRTTNDETPVIAAELFSR
jgi:hypothetical protein